MEHGIAREAKLAQDFSHRAHNFGQALGAEYDQRDRQNDNYFKEVQASMTVRSESPFNSMTAPRAGKFPATPICQLIIIPDFGVNDA